MQLCISYRNYLVISKKKWTKLEFSQILIPLALNYKICIYYRILMKFCLKHIYLIISSNLGSDLKCLQMPLNKC